MASPSRSSSVARKSSSASLRARLSSDDLLLLVGVDDVERLEVVVDVDGELAEAALLLGGRQLGRRGQVADVADAGLDVEAGPEVAGDRLRLRGRLDDHQPPGAGLLLVVRGHRLLVPACPVVVTGRVVRSSERLVQRAGRGLMVPRPVKGMVSGHPPRP